MKRAIWQGGPRWLAAAGLLALIVALHAGCARRRGTPIATLLEAQGGVQLRDGEAWQDVAPPFAFVVGDTLRTGPRSSARLQTSSGIIRLGENGQLHFSPGAVTRPQEPEISFDLGSAEIENAGGDLSVTTAAGPVRVERGARVRIRADGGGATLEVFVGRAVLMKDDGQTVVEAGEGVAIKIGNAVPDRFRVRVGEAVVETAPPPPAVALVAPPPPSPPGQPSPSRDSAEATAERAAARDGGGRADVTLPAGGNAIIHDGKPPLTVRLRFDALCPGDGTVEVGQERHGQRLIGGGSVVLRLRRGALAYRVRCASDDRGARPRAAGVLSLKRDSGNVALSRTAPVNNIDADGRRYTVMFQTRLPKLTLLWPSAPAAAHDLELHVDGAAGPRVFQAPSARYQLASGTLPEGTYTWWYATSDGRQSPQTTTTIRFDNTAPTVQFFDDGSAAAPAGAVAIDGVTLEGARISVGERALPVDDHGRFRDAVQPLPGDDAVAIRLEHPRTGVHYYVRRRPAR